jgi:hypothetical protein
MSEHSDEIRDFLIIRLSRSAYERLEMVFFEQYLK